MAPWSHRRCGSTTFLSHEQLVHLSHGIDNARRFRLQQRLQFADDSRNWRPSAVTVATISATVHQRVCLRRSGRQWRHFMRGAHGVMQQVIGGVSSESPTLPRAMGLCLRESGDHFSGHSFADRPIFKVQGRSSIAVIPIISDPGYFGKTDPNAFCPGSIANKYANGCTHRPGGTPAERVLRAGANQP
jgi:hypothetical protein